MRSPRRGVALVLGAVLAEALVAGVASGQVGPPPTPVPPSGSPSPFVSALLTPADPVPPPEVGAASALLVDLGHQQSLFAESAQARRPVASLTKLMTALIVVARTKPSDVVTVDPDAVFDADRFGSSSILGLRAGEQLSVRELLYGLLLASANDAAVALAIHVSGGAGAFVDAMNQRAAALGMRNTMFRSSNGLDDRGYSTAEDLVRLVRAVRRSPLLRRIVATKFHDVPAPGGEEPRHIQNRNPLLWLYPGATGMKTGFTAGAGHCTIATAERDGRTLVAVVLGARSDPFSSAAALLNHGFEGFTEHTFVSAGESLGMLALDGGAVPVRAGAALAALVPVASTGSARRSIHADTKVGFPPAPGDVVGTIEVTLEGASLGSVPMVVRSVPAPEPASGGPWWARAVDATAGAVVDAVRGIAA